MTHATPRVEKGGRKGDRAGVGKTIQLGNQSAITLVQMTYGQFNGKGTLMAETVEIRTEW